MPALRLPDLYDESHQLRACVTAQLPVVRVRSGLRVTFRDKSQVPPGDRTFLTKWQSLRQLHPSVKPITSSGVLHCSRLPQLWKSRREQCTPSQRSNSLLVRRTVCLGYKSPVSGGW